jgi:hypothetical protein
MKKLVVVPILIGICLLTACGSGGSGVTPVGAGQGNFSKATLKGQYAYQIAGYDLTNNGAPYREAGYFVADGNGNLTSGSDDFSEAPTGGAQNNSTSGTYSIANDGTGTLTLSVAGNALTFSLTMVSANEVLMNEADSGAIAAGRADLQTSSVLSSVPSGTFVFRIHSCVSCTGGDSASLVGAMKVAGGSVTGFDDVLRGGIFDNNNTTVPLTITGSLNTPTSSGRGTGSITDATGTVNFIYYVVDSKTLRFLVSDSGVIGIGSAEAQSGTFSNSTLNGSYVFGSRADDSNTGLTAQNTVGVFTAGGNGTISAGTLDSVRDGNSYTQVGLSGSYTVSSNGRAVVTLSPSGLASIEEVLWMVSPSRAFLLTDDTSKVEDGTADQQQGSFSNGSLNGQYAFSMDGLEFASSSTVALTQVGWIIWNGSGTLTWNEAMNNSSSGSGSSENLSGTYSVANNGRTTATVNNLSINSNDIVVYLVSNSKAYMLQNDTGVEIVGTMATQTSP